MPRIFFSFPLMAFAVFLVSINLVQARSFNNDFETGDLTDWKMDDTKNNAFEFQPTWGDNPTARNRGQPSKHQGDWWIGTYEKYQGPIKGKKLKQKPGDKQGDGPKAK